MSSVTATASCTPCGIVVHDISPIELSTQNVLNSSDLYLTITPAPTGVPSGCRTLPVTWLVGWTFTTTSIELDGAGIVASRLMGSGLNGPAALSVNEPGQSPVIENLPVPKFVSTIWKFWTYWKSTTTRPPAIAG